MAFSFSIPRPTSDPIVVSAEAGHVIYVLGANGAGKSSLMLSLYQQNRERARRISAHRQTWFSSNSLNMSPHDRRATETNIRNIDSQVESRWKDSYSEQRTNLAIYDLIDAENVRARLIAGAVDAGNLSLAAEHSKTEAAPVTVINELLNLSNLPIEITILGNEQVMASKSGSEPFSVAELSDGERNALLIAANVLTAKADSLILIDEPERHLHRSIISPLLTNLFARRPDCAFVVSTHDVTLSMDTPDSQTLLVRGCTYRQRAVVSWDADLVPSDLGIDDNLKMSILGSRRRLLFVEGVDQSLDKPLYSLVFPDVSVLPKSSCRDVEHAVAEIRSAEHLHWLHAFGLVDNDRRMPQDIERLRQLGVHALPVFSVESVYYHPAMQRRIANRQAGVTGDRPEDLINAAVTGALKAITQSAQHLSERTAEKAIRADLLGRLPTRKGISTGVPIEVTIDVASAVAAERERLDKAVGAKNLDYVIAQYPVRETSALRAIAQALGFQGSNQYERAVLKLLQDDHDALGFVRGLFGTLFEEMTSS